jgi:hypothetical protein
MREAGDAELIMRKILMISLAALVFFSLPACTRLFKWVPVRSGVEFEGDSVIRIENVEIKVRDFGVLNSWGRPVFSLLINNRSEGEVIFDPSACRLDIEGRRVAPTRHPPLGIEHLAAGDRLSVDISFDSGLRLVKRDDPHRRDMRVVPEVLELHLAPIEIGGQRHTLPVLSYRNPSPENS